MPGFGEPVVALSLVGRPSANLALDRIQSCDSLQRLTGDRRGVSLLQVVELAPHVRPTGDFPNPAIFFIELIESGIGISLQRTLKRTQMLLGKFTLAIGRVREPDSGRGVFTGGPVVFRDRRPVDATDFAAQAVRRLVAARTGAGL